MDTLASVTSYGQVTRNSASPAVCSELAESSLVLDTPLLSFLVQYPFAQGAFIFDETLLTILCPMDQYGLVLDLNASVENRSPRHKCLHCSHTLSYEWLTKDVFDGKNLSMLLENLLQEVFTPLEAIYARSVFEDNFITEVEKYFLAKE